MKLSDLKILIKETLVHLSESEEDEWMLGYDKQDEYNYVMRQNKWKRLSKLDEIEALQYINKILIPIVVNRANNSPRFKHFGFTEEFVRNNLKKTKHYRTSIYDYEGDATKTDYIMYSFDIIYEKEPIKNKFTVCRFTIKKDNRTKALVVVVFENLFNTHNEYRVGTYGDNLVARMIRENKEMIVEDEYGPRRPIISKVEEQHALQLILKKLMPIAVGKYNLQAITRWAAPQITKEQALKSFKKINKEQLANGQQINYFIKLPNTKTSIDFRISKLAYRKDSGDTENKNVFTISYYDLSAQGWGTFAWVSYDVEDLVNNPDIDLGMLTESVNRTITKLDEVEGTNYIRRVLIPISSKHWNKLLNGLGLKYLSLQVTDKEILSKFKKIGHARHSTKDGTTTDVIRFNSIVRRNTSKDEIISIVFMFELYRGLNKGELIADYTVPPSIKQGGETIPYFVGQIPDDIY